MGRKLLKFKNKFDGIIFNSIVRLHNCHFDVLRQLKRYKVFNVSFFFVKFGGRGNCGLLIPNLSSKTQYQHIILTLSPLGRGGGGAE